MKIQVDLSQGDRKTWVSFPQSLHGQFKIKSPLWSQAWDSIPLVRLEGRGAPWKAPDVPLGGTDTLFKSMVMS